MSPSLRALAPALLLLAACSTSGGTVLGFPAPKFLDGKIEHGVYTAEDGSFSVAVPHAEDSNEFKHMQVKEQGEGHEHYVSFGPAAICQGIWRVQVSPVVDPSRTPANFDTAFDAITNHTLAQLADAYKSQATLTAESREPLDGHPARHRSYVQHVPEGDFYNNKEATITHEALFVDLGKAVAFVWVQSGPTDLPASGLSALDFARSIRLH